ncbi:hypothetical protein NST14_05225 [Bacillus sp. FSL W8-0519]|uniref:hypothetical protein n=1 Tax=Bacillus TaxID=1386 RepID=UPI001E4004F0|nr:hypothetical protein [Bacillus paranthracis]MCC2413072.1 hypothetical protein [Bacillus paranthracis]
MIAEIYNKISQTGSNLSNRLEDKLTGDFFGTIRYLPFEIGMKLVLSSVRFNEKTIDDEWQKLISDWEGHPGQLDFWHRHFEGEIDLLLRLHNAVVGIEVKYLSGISSEDEETEQIISAEESKNQLARYARMLDDIGGVLPKFLVFLAPFPIMQSVEKVLGNHSIISKNVSLGFLSWQGVLESLQGIDINSLEQWQIMIIEDLKALLVKKGFVRFTGFTTVLEEDFVTKDGYIFHGQLNRYNTLIWPLDKIKEVNPYVFNK